MAKSFELDMSRFESALRQTPEAMSKGVRQAMDDIKDDWVKEARDLAPLKSRNLRDQISGDVEGNGSETKVIVTANARQGGFNYGYYIHELDAGGNQLRLKGAEKKFLDKAADNSEQKWQQWLDEEVEEALKKAGW
ncbi:MULTISPECIES: hypothetical protein [Bacillus]|uniref:hypothetical protein n=1 Tax=Bacillus TaxID=1386 RepID=UPI000315B9E6|nr:MULTISPECIES: hypothetical protein [Bacillus]